MSDDKEELVLPGENVRPKGKIGIRHLVVFMGLCAPHRPSNVVIQEMLTFI